MTMPGEHLTDRPTAPKGQLLAWNLAGYALYAGLAGIGVYAIWFSFFFGMATDGCHDAACEADYHVYPAMLTVWIGVGGVLLATLAVMVAQSVRGKIVAGWPFAGLVAVAVVVLAAKDFVLH